MAEDGESETRSRAGFSGRLPAYDASPGPSKKKRKLTSAVPSCGVAPSVRNSRRTGSCEGSGSAAGQISTNQSASSFVPPSLLAGCEAI